MAEGKFDGLGISVNDVEAMTRFYVEGLGCTASDAIGLPEDVIAKLAVLPSGLQIKALVTPGGLKLKLVQSPGQESPAEAPTSITGRTGVTYLTFLVPDVAATRDALVALGGTALSDPALEKAAAFVADPEGNLVELLRPPKTA